MSTLKRFLKITHTARTGHRLGFDTTFPIPALHSDKPFKCVAISKLES
jgi:hypothetical protein